MFQLFSCLILESEGLIYIWPKSVNRQQTGLVICVLPSDSFEELKQLVQGSQTAETCAAEGLKCLQECHLALH